jgi:predicted amidohydrolase YtcJ
LIKVVALMTTSVNTLAGMALALSCTASTIALGAATPNTPDSNTSALLLHGHVYTGDPKTPWVTALAVDNGRIAALGSDADVAKRRPPKAAVIDLKGQTVIPGIVDSHMHMLYGAYALHGLNLSTPEASITPDNPVLLVSRLKAYAESNADDPVLFARADFSTVPPTTPTAALLDRAVPNRPLVVHNTSEHALWLNTAALKLTGLNTDPVADPDEERGVIRDASGHATGVLLEAGMQIAVRAVAKQMTTDRQLAMLRVATHYLNSFGITSVVNATGDLDELKLYAALRDRGELTVRTRTAFGAVAVPHHLTPRFLSDLEQARTLYHDDWVSANLVKFFADGSTGLIAPLVYTPKEYAALVMELDSRGFQLMTHALRDDSVHMILDTYERVEKEHGPRDRRLRIEHADLVTPTDVPRFGSLGVIAGMQPSFCCGLPDSTSDPATTLVADRWHSLAAGGATLAFSSDWPCTWPPNPFVSIEETVTREAWRSADTANVAGETLDGAAQGGASKTGQAYTPEERISVDTALRAYTQGSAYAAFFDDRVGTLTVGKLADLAVLSQDIFTVDPSTIGKTRVTLTMVGGRVVYRGT